MIILIGLDCSDWIDWRDWSGDVNGISDTIKTL